MIVCLSMVYLKSATLVHSTCVAFSIELEFSSVGFCGEGKTREHAEKCEERTNYKLYPHKRQGAGIKLLDRN